MEAFQDWARYWADYFPPLAFISAFLVPFVLSEVDRWLHRKRSLDQRRSPGQKRSPGQERSPGPEFVPFLKDPSTWFYKITLVPLGSFTFARLVKCAPGNIPHWVSITIFLFASIIAFGITVDTLKRFVSVKFLRKEITNEELGISKKWHSYWWAWRRGEVQAGAMYSNFLIFPLEYFFSAIALGLVLYFPFHTLVSGEAVTLKPILIGNAFVFLTGLGMIFNLLYYPRIYPDLYKRKIVYIYVVIYINCAFFGLYGLYMVKYESVVASALSLMGHAATLAGIGFSSAIETGLLWVVRKLSAPLALRAGHLSIPRTLQHRTLQHRPRPRSDRAPSLVRRRRRSR